MPSNRQPPPIAPCPCPKRCKATMMQTLPGLWRVVSDCGYAGPQRFTPRTAREAWNRRDSAEAERRGAVAVANWLWSKGKISEALWVEQAIERGEVLPTAKPEPDVMTQKRCGQGKDAPEERRCPYLRKNGKCRTFQCSKCRRSYPWCQGAADDHPNWCDHCSMSEDQKPSPLIVSKPGVMGGKPCVAGTRITVETIQRVAREWSSAKILEEYPGLTPEGLAAALAYRLPGKKARKRI